MPVKKERDVTRPGSPAAGSWLSQHWHPGLQLPACSWWDNSPQMREACAAPRASLAATSWLLLRLASKFGRLNNMKKMKNQSEK